MNDKAYEKKIQEVNLIIAENECVDAIQRQVEFANKHVMKTHKLALSIIE